MSRHPEFIRHTRLAHRNWGPCDECGSSRPEFYAIWDMSPKEPGMCVCAKCVGPASEEIPEEADIYHPRASDALLNAYRERLDDITDLITRETDTGPVFDLTLLDADQVEQRFLELLNSPVRGNGG